MALLVDLNVIKATVAALRPRRRHEHEAAAEAASRLAGFYRAAQTFAFVPYQLILSVTFVVFPMVSQAVSIGDEEASRRYIRNAMRFSLIVLAGDRRAGQRRGRGRDARRVSGRYLAGSDALAVLSLGMVCFALFVIGATILSGAGRPGLSAAIAGGAVALVIGGNLVLLHLAGIGTAHAARGRGGHVARHGVRVGRGRVRGARALRDVHRARTALRALTSAAAGCLHVLGSVVLSVRAFLGSRRCRCRAGVLSSVQLLWHFRVSRMGVAKGSAPT